LLSNQAGRMEVTARPAGAGCGVRGQL